jgi:hypothetical protein
MVVARWSSRAAVNPQWPTLLLSEAAIRIGKFSTSCAAVRELSYLRAVLFGSRAIGVRRGAPIHM